MAATMRTDVGRRRRQNEDAAWFDEGRGVFAVAEGMGGHRAGEVASAMAIHAVRQMADTHRTADITDLIANTVGGLAGYLLFLPFAGPLLRLCREP